MKLLYDKTELVELSIIPEKAYLLSKYLVHILSAFHLWDMDFCLPIQYLGDRKFLLLLKKMLNIMMIEKVE